MKISQFINSTNRTKQWPMRALEITLLAVSAWRTWDFITLIMAGLTGVKFYAILSVIVSEGAYLIWSKAAYPEADEGTQESITIAMIGLNTLGLLLLSFGENLLRATSGFEWSAAAADILKFTPWAMLAANLIGALLFGITDDDHIDAKRTKAQMRLDRNAERDLKHAERLGHVNAKLAAIQMLEDNQDQIARKLAPYYYQDIAGRIAGQTMTNLQLGEESKPALNKEAQIPDEVAEFVNNPVLFSSNGGNHRPKVIR